MIAEINNESIHSLENKLISRQNKKDAKSCVSLKKGVISCIEDFSNHCSKNLACSRYQHFFFVPSDLEWLEKDSQQI